MRRASAGGWIALILFGTQTVAGQPLAENDPAVLRLLQPDYPIERVQVDASHYPWSAIGRISALGGRHFCTGALVDERYVLTAAHCVWPFRNLPDEVHFLAGFQRDSYVAHSRARGFRIAPRYTHNTRSPESFADDWALIELEQPIGLDAGYLGWAMLDDNALETVGSAGIHVALSGYRADRRFVQTVDHECRLTASDEHERLWQHECPIMAGDSGGPLLLHQGEAGYLLLGIDVGGSVTWRGRKPWQRPRITRGFAVSGATLGSALSELRGSPHEFANSPGFVGRRGMPRVPVE